MSRRVDPQISSGAMSAQPCCGPASISLACGIPLGEAMLAVQVAGGYVSPRWRGAVKAVAHLETAIKAVGWSSKRITDGRGVTLRCWVDEFSRPSGVYIVRTGNHFQAVVRQVVSDQQQQLRHADDFWGARKRVTHILELKEKA